jgi:hypothetical protein
MKITKQQLKQIIKEELNSVIQEQDAIVEAASGPEPLSIWDVQGNPELIIQLIKEQSKNIRSALVTIATATQNYTMYDGDNKRPEEITKNLPNGGEAQMLPNMRQAWIFRKGAEDCIAMIKRVVQLTKETKPVKTWAVKKDNP